MSLTKDRDKLREDNEKSISDLQSLRMVSMPAHFQRDLVCGYNGSLEILLTFII